MTNLYAWMVCAMCAAHGAETGAASAATSPGVRLLGRVEVPGTARDRSGLTDTLESGTPHDRLGGFGSAIEFAGGDRYILLPDRGPRDGADRYQCRWHEADIVVGPGGKVTFTLVSTHLLRDETGGPLHGLSAALGPDRARFDPEGVRRLGDGSLLISDEYGPHVWRFDRATGRKRSAFAVPAAFAPEHPHADAKEEARRNTRGRVPNNGIEGLAVSEDGRRAFALLQGPLIQDGGKTGENLRLVEFDTATGAATRQYVYAVGAPGLRTNEILWAGEGTFLVIERDGEGGAKAKVKRVMVASLPARSDEPGDRLPARRGDLPAGVVPMRTRVLLDLLDLDSALPRERFPAKVEGLAWGPDLPTGERLLLIASDNDFKADEASVIWAVAVEGSRLRGE